MPTTNGGSCRNHNRNRQAMSKGDADNANASTDRHHAGEDQCERANELRYKRLTFQALLPPRIRPELGRIVIDVVRARLENLIDLLHHFLIKTDGACLNGLP